MSSRGIETREKLVETALRLFRDEGFAATTMRKIANEAEVSLGNAYYYFASKDELVHELYLVIQRDHRARALPLLREGGSLTENLRIVLHTGSMSWALSRLRQHVSARCPAHHITVQPVLGRVDRCEIDGRRSDA